MRLGRFANVVLFVTLCSLSSLCLIVQIRHWDNALSIVDPGSEANALREVRHFLEDGLTSHYGLGTVVYPGMYPDDGIVSSYLDNPKSTHDKTDYVRLHVLTADGVYTHYPPGPEYLLLAAAKVLGFDPVWRLRLLPIAFGWGATLFLSFAVRRRFGAFPGWLVAGALVLTPSVTCGFVGLHDQGYALALTMIEAGCLLGRGTHILPFAVLGFVQGWLSFDQVFLVSLMPISTEWAMPSIDPAYRRRWKLAVWRTALAGGGFALAHGLHFMQVWAYFGSLAGALHDLGAAAAYRSGGEESLSNHLLHVVGSLVLYFVGWPAFSIGSVIPNPLEAGAGPMFRVLGLTLGPWWALVMVGLTVWGIRRPASQAAAIRSRWQKVFAAGMATSSIWLVAMVNHAWVHEQFLYRHLFFTYFLCILFAAVAIGRGQFGLSGAGVRGGQAVG